MSRVEEIEDELAKLSVEEFAQIREWILDREADEWDRQIERDAKAGKLDRLFEDALEEHRQGKTTEL
jgi:hypothetical protein